MNNLASLEAIIERGKLAYIEVGNALREIQEGKLYRDHGYATFEHYCKKRWGFSRSVGYDYLAASKTAGNIESVGLTLQNQPSFTQAVVLSRLQPEEQRQIASETDFAITTVRELSQKIEPRCYQEPKDRSKSVFQILENDATRLEWVEKRIRYTDEVNETWTQYHPQEMGDFWKRVKGAAERILDMAQTRA